MYTQIFFYEYFLFSYLFQLLTRVPVTKEEARVLTSVL